LSHSGLTDLIRKTPKGIVPQPSLPEILEAWMSEAKAKGNAQPDAMILATSNSKGLPSARVVLFKGWTDEGVFFVTNYESQKGQELHRRPHCHLVFYWTELGRQIRITGKIKKASRAISEEYFNARPRESQLGAWASRQSRPIEDYTKLMDRYAAFAKKFEGQSVPCPPYWGGFWVRPEKVELWIGQVGRLHQRMMFKRKGTQWLGQWLSP
jgi:pyridoxamine 5'-phosphate oxidase